MICKKCGNEIKEGNTFCTNCGNNVNENIDNGKKTITIKLHQLVIGIIAIILVIVCIGVYIINKNKIDNNQHENISLSDTGSKVDKLDEKISNPIATMEIEDYGTMKIELYPKQAPEAVKNFIALSNNGFYDNLTFHRIVHGFMIQGGDKNGDGTGYPRVSDINKTVQKNSIEDHEYTIKGEFKLNGVNNNIKFEKGVIAMARANYTSYSEELKDQSYNSAGSQFFIMTEDDSRLDGIYAAFGKVIEGMDVLDKLDTCEVESAENGEQSKPIKAPVIKSIRVDTNGYDYGLPETSKAFNFTKWLNGEEDENSTGKYYSFIDEEYGTFDFTESEFINRFMQGNSYTSQGFDRSVSTQKNTYNYTKVNTNGIQTISITNDNRNNKISKINLMFISNTYTENQISQVANTMFNNLIGYIVYPNTNNSEEIKYFQNVVQEILTNQSINKGLKYTGNIEKIGESSLSVNIEIEVIK